MSKQYSLGIVGTSYKENEKRVGVHPDHFLEISEDLRKRIYIEKGYGEPFHVPDSELKELFAGVLSREELFAKCDIMLLAKPTDGDFPYFKEGQILWGWAHLVQGPGITQTGIDKKMTMITWESMQTWRGKTRKMHTFAKNNELAGYSAVLHATHIKGITGHYGKHKKAAVIGYGSVARGAIHALNGLGFYDVSVFNISDHYNTPHQIPGVNYNKMLIDDGKASVNGKPMIDILSDYDIIINGIFQDTDHPLMFVMNIEVPTLKKGCMIIDVSCDEGMGFEFSKPTKFEDPTFYVQDHLTYYAVDHTPSYLWNSASFEISKSIISFIEDVMNGNWENDTIKNAIEMKDGIILNEKIISFQKREKEYPHSVKI